MIQEVEQQGDGGTAQDFLGGDGDGSAPAPALPFLPTHLQAHVVKMACGAADASAAATGLSTRHFAVLRLVSRAWRAATDASLPALSPALLEGRRAAALLARFPGTEEFDLRSVRRGRLHDSTLDECLAALPAGLASLDLTPAVHTHVLDPMRGAGAGGDVRFTHRVLRHLTRLTALQHLDISCCKPNTQPQSLEERDAWRLVALAPTLRSLSVGWSFAGSGRWEGSPPCLQVVMHLTNLRVLQIQMPGRSVEVDWAAILPPLQQLQRLYIVDATPEPLDQDPGFREALRCLPNLRHLSADSVMHLFGPSHFSLLSSLTAIETRDHPRLGEAFAAHTASHLRRLRLGGSCVPERVWAPLLSSLTGLTHLGIHGGVEAIPGDAWAALGGATRLRELDLAGREWTLGAACRAVQLASNSALCSLALSMGPVAEHAAAQDNEQALSGVLYELSPALTSLRIANGGLGSLAPIAALVPRLRDLGVSRSSRLSDGGLRDLTRMTALTRLAIDSCERVTGAALSHLSPPRHGRLRDLHMLGTAVDLKSLEPLLALPSLDAVAVEVRMGGVGAGAGSAPTPGASLAGTRTWAVNRGGMRSLLRLMRDEVQHAVRAGRRGGTSCWQGHGGGRGEGGGGGMQLGEALRGMLAAARVEESNPWA